MTGTPIAYHLVRSHNELECTCCQALVEGVGREQGVEVGAVSSALLCCQHRLQDIVIQFYTLQGVRIN